jgi:hypothetical protein
MKTLHLVLKKQWYDMIESGVKIEEYRELKPYWLKRLTYICDTPFCCHNCDNCNCENAANECCDSKCFEKVVFHYGYTNRTMSFECVNITIGYGNTLWGAPTNKKVIIIKLGKRL